MGSLSIGHWLIVLVVVVLIFGTKKLGNVGSDLGKAVKGFKDGMRNDEESSRPPASRLSRSRRSRWLTSRPSTWKRAKRLRLVTDS